MSILPFRIRPPRIRERYYLLALKSPDQDIEPLGCSLLVLHDKRKNTYTVVRNTKPIEIPKDTMVAKDETAFLKTGWAKGLRVVLKNIYHPSKSKNRNTKLKPIPEELIGYIPAKELDEETKHFLKKL